MTWTRTRILALLLFLSVALNLFIGGIAIGHWDHLGFRGGPDGPGGPGKPMSRLIEDTLGPDLSPDIRALIEEHESEIQTTREAARESRKAIRDILMTEPFDRAAYVGALESMKVIHDRMRDETHSFMLDIVGRLTPEQRRKLVESLDRPRKFR